VDDRNQPAHPGADRFAELEEPLALRLREEDALLGDALAEHFILRLEEFNLSAKLMFRGAGKQEQQRLKHPALDRGIVSMKTQNKSDNPFAPRLWSPDNTSGAPSAVQNRQCQPATPAAIRRQS
jgi:hypothetical protein